MKIEREMKKDRDGYTVTKTVKTITEEDGWVRKKDMHSVNMRPGRGRFKGRAKVVSFSTSNPKITRPFAYGVSMLFIVIGVCMFLLSGGITKVMGAFFAGMGAFALVDSKRDIDAVEERMRRRQEEAADTGEEQKFPGEGE